MKIKESARMFAGACVVYYVLAACSAADKGAASSGPGAGEGGATSGAPGEGSLAPSSSSPAPTSSAPAPAPTGTGPTITNPVPEAQAYTSGSRIKAKRYVTADGAKQFTGWYDVQLQKDVGLGRMCPNDQRFVPYYPTLFASAYFGDSMCTQRVWSVGGQQVSGPSVIVTDTCSKVYDLGAAPQALYVKQTNGTCTLNTTDFYGPSGYRFLGAETPASSYVAATVQLDP